MALQVSQLPKNIGVQVYGFDPMNLSAADISQFQTLFNDNSVILIRNIPLSPEKHLELTKALGEPGIHPMATGRLEGYPEILVPRPYGLATSEDPEEIIGRIPWHADLTFTTSPPRGALLRAVEIPAEGGQTGFIDTARVYSELDASLKQRIQGLQAVHRMVYGQRQLGFDVDEQQAAEVSKRFPDVTQPLVQTDPESGVVSLNISPLFLEYILDMASGESRALLDELQTIATQEQYVYWHEWQQDDLVIWNNYRTLHCAAGHPQKFPRTMHRTTLESRTAMGKLLAA